MIILKLQPKKFPSWIIPPRWVNFLFYTWPDLSKNVKKFNSTKLIVQLILSNLSIDSYEDCNFSFSFKWFRINKSTFSNNFYIIFKDNKIRYKQKTKKKSTKRKSVFIMDISSIFETNTVFKVAILHSRYIQNIWSWLLCP